MKYSKLVLWAMSIIILPVLLFSQSSVEEYFQKNCQVCHTIGGGKIIGPDLKNVEARADREWLINWMLDPAGVLSSGDAYAQKIFKDANNVPMTVSPGINAELAAELLDYIQEKSQSGSNSEKTGIPDKFSTEDIILGKALFSGKTKLKNNGPACISCHTVNSLPGLGGGKLGLNLTDVYTRLGGVRGLNSWLKSPPSLTMTPIFSKHKLEQNEISSLIGYLKNESEISNNPVVATMGSFLLYGVLGVSVMFLLIGIIWNYRFRAVRKPMISKNK